jgi:nucleoside-diphosphate-sugar epimerase
VSSKGIESLCTWQAEVIDPAVIGTLNVLASCAKAQTKKVVFTSSISAIIFTNKRNSTGGIDESLWSDEDYCRENKVLWSSNFASYIFLVLIFQGIVKFDFCLLHLLILDL